VYQTKSLLRRCERVGVRETFDETFTPPPHDRTHARRKVLDSVPAGVQDLSIWNYDGSSTGQAPGHDSEVLIK
jgi:hypothetical protein